MVIQKMRLKDLKDNALEMVCFKKFVKESIMKNLVLKERKNQKLLEKENFNIKVRKIGKKPIFFGFLNNKIILQYTKLYLKIERNEKIEISKTRN